MRGTEAIRAPTEFSHVGLQVNLFKKVFLSTDPQTDTPSLYASRPDTVPAGNHVNAAPQASFATG